MVNLVSDGESVPLIFTKKIGTNVVETKKNIAEAASSDHYEQELKSGQKIKVTTYTVEEEEAQFIEECSNSSDPLENVTSGSRSSSCYSLENLKSQSLQRRKRYRLKVSGESGSVLHNREV